MTKRICFFILTSIAILFVWATFADIISPGTHYVDICVKLENVEIDNYRLVIENFGPMTDRIYEPEVWKCLYGYYKFWESRQFLLDKSVNIEEITHENIKDKAILIWEWSLGENWYRVLNANPLTKWTIIYAIIKDWDNYTIKRKDSKLSADLNWWNIFKIAPLKVDILDKDNNKKVGSTRNEDFLRDSGLVIRFLIACFLTILIEATLLFIIAKLFRKKYQIPSLKTLLIGFIASTITLPLLRFILPLFIVEWEEYTVIWEPLAIIIETFIIKYWLKVPRWKGAWASIVCNIVSYLAWFYLFNILYF